jgi:hypothetical protein
LCAPGKQVGLTAKASAHRVAGMDQAAALALLRAVAADCGVGLTPHRTVIQRALGAVETVNQRIADLQKNGDMRELNAEFKAARKAGTVARYHDFLHAKKVAMLEAIARRAGR